MKTLSITFKSKNAYIPSGIYITIESRNAFGNCFVSTSIVYRFFGSSDSLCPIHYIK